MHVLRTQFKFHFFFVCVCFFVKVVDANDKLFAAISNWFIVLFSVSIYMSERKIGCYIRIHDRRKQIISFSFKVVNIISSLVCDGKLKTNNNKCSTVQLLQSFELIPNAKSCASLNSQFRLKTIWNSENLFWAFKYM